MGFRDRRDGGNLMLEWWLVELGLKDRPRYRKLRELAWQFVVENSESFDRTNKVS